MTLRNTSAKVQDVDMKNDLARGTINVKAINCLISSNRHAIGIVHCKSQHGIHFSGLRHHTLFLSGSYSPLLLALEQLTNIHCIYGTLHITPHFIMLALETFDILSHLCSYLLVICNIQVSDLESTYIMWRATLPTSATPLLSFFPRGSSCGTTEDHSVPRRRANHRPH